MAKGAAKDAMDGKAFKLMLENSIALQKVLTNLAVSLDRLSKDMEKMLDLFKEASKAMGEEKALGEVDMDRENKLISRLDNLIEQNRTIAKGLVLLESSIKEKDRQKEYGF